LAANVEGVNVEIMDKNKFKAIGKPKDMLAFMKAISDYKGLLIDRFRKSAEVFRFDHTIEPGNSQRYMSEFSCYPDVVVKLQPKNKG
jgi:hypothetical protein